MVKPGSGAMGAGDVETLVRQGIDLVQIEAPDINGTLRGKLTRLTKVAGANGSAFCTILYGLSHYDDVVESRFSSFANGFPDKAAVPDLSTLRVIDCERGVAAVICDMREPETGASYALCPRSALARIVARAARLGFEPRFAVELEMCVLEADDAAVLDGHHHALEARGRLRNAYSLARMHEMREITAGFMRAMDAIGIPIEAMHAELGRGMMELAISHLPALEAADACARVKLYLKDWLARHGLVGVFMPKWRVDESGCGGHVHQSLWRDGKPAFAAPDGTLSETARQYVAGQLACLVDCAAIFYPTINAYRRMDAGSWAPENVSWGIDNRTCALRAILRPGPAAFRIEHRCPGADINPYLAIAAMLAGGLDGIEAGARPPEPIEGNSVVVAGLSRLPNSLAQATEILANSETVQRMLGAEIVEQFVATRRAECRLYDEWQRGRISEWELTHYFDIH